MQTILYVSIFRQIMAVVFSFIFFALSVVLSGITIQAMAEGAFGSMQLIEAFLKAINMAVISLATFELGLVVIKEYGGKDDDGHIVVVLRRTLPRFVSIVCIALVLEGLLMVIKYSQLDLAGNLYYPVAIIISAALLLMGLGVFLRLSDAATFQVEQAASQDEPGAQHCQVSRLIQPRQAIFRPQTRSLYDGRLTRQFMSTRCLGAGDEGSDRHAQDA